MPILRDFGPACAEAVARGEAPPKRKRGRRNGAELVDVVGGSPEIDGAPRCDVLYPLGEDRQRSDRRYVAGCGISIVPVGRILDRMSVTVSGACSRCIHVWHTRDLLTS